MKLTNLVCAGAAISLIGGAAHAMTMDPEMVYSAETCSVMDVLDYSDDCYGAVLDDMPDGENDSEKLFNTGIFFDDLDEFDDGLDGDGYTTGLFDITDWMQLAKVEGGSGTDGDLTIELPGDATDPYDGTWSWSGSIYENMVIVLKQGNTFAAYLYKDGSFDTEGEWDTTASVFGNNAGGISHISVYKSGAVVPLPAAGWLLLGGLGGLYAMKRRRRA